MASQSTGHQAQAVQLELDLAPEPERPRTRADCIDGPRPCPWAGCRYHLLLNVRDGGHLDIRRNRSGRELEPHELEETCALDVAERGGESQSEVARLLGITGQGVGVGCKRALDRMRRKLRSL